MTSDDFVKVQPKLLIKAVIQDSVHIVQSPLSSPVTSDYIVLKTDEILQYHPFCDDFGPMDLAQVTKFITLLSDTLRNPQLTEPCKVVFVVEPGRRAMTNMGELYL